MYTVGMKNIWRFLSLVVVIIAWALAIYYYPKLPTLVASHWDINGNVNGCVSQFWGAFLLPIIMTVLSVLFLLLPFLDPKKDNYQHFERQYNQIVGVLLLYLLIIDAALLSYALGGSIHLPTVIAGGLAALFFTVGTVLPHVHQNWFVGIRTPWALENVTVWNDTQRFGGRAFQVAGLFCVIGALLPAYTFVFVLAPILIATIASVVYSYLRFNQLQAGKVNGKQNNEHS